MGCCDFNTNNILNHENNDMVKYNELEALKKKTYYMTKKESYLYFFIKEILPSDYEVKAQIQLLSLINITKTDNISLFNKIKAKSIDYCIFKTTHYKDYPYKNLTPVLAIELDDYSHTSQNRAERDMFVNDVFEQIEIELIHINGDGYIDKEKVRKLILDKLK